MSITIRYLALGEESDLVVNWFRKQPGVSNEADRTDGKWFHFGDSDPLAPPSKPDPKASPLVYVVVPRRVRGALWTVGEIGFTPTALKAEFPKLYATSVRLRAWLREFELVFNSKAPATCENAYFLEGGVCNVMADVYALPQAAGALRGGGQYFVPDEIKETHLDTVCAKLRLRGVAC